MRTAPDTSPSTAGRDVSPAFAATPSAAPRCRALQPSTTSVVATTRRPSPSSSPADLAAEARAPARPIASRLHERKWPAEPSAVRNRRRRSRAAVGRPGVGAARDMRQWCGGLGLTGAASLTDVLAVQFVPLDRIGQQVHDRGRPASALVACKVPPDWSAGSGSVPANSSRSCCRLSHRSPIASDALTIRRCRGRCGCRSADREGTRGASRRPGCSG